MAAKSPPNHNNESTRRGTQRAKPTPTRWQGPRLPVPMQEFHDCYCGPLGHLHGTRAEIAGCCRFVLEIHDLRRAQSEGHLPEFYDADIAQLLGADAVDHTPSYADAHGVTDEAPVDAENAGQAEDAGATQNA